jgi:hypothetical protein
MSIGKVIAGILAAILVFFGVLFIWGSFSPQGGGTAWVVIGLISVGIGVGILAITFRRSAAASQEPGVTQNVTLDIDLPGDVKIEKFTCQNCGNPLTKDDIKLVAGAPTVNCPYCGQVYQLTEAPKW